MPSAHMICREQRRGRRKRMWLLVTRERRETGGDKSACVRSSFAYSGLPCSWLCLERACVVRGFLLVRMLLNGEEKLRHGRTGERRFGHGTTTRERTGERTRIERRHLRSQRQVGEWRGMWLHMLLQVRRSHVKECGGQRRWLTSGGG